MKHEKATAAEPVVVDHNGDTLTDQNGRALVGVAKQPVEPVLVGDPPPNRFSREGKEKWADTPEPVRAEITRMVDEMTRGFNERRAAAKRYEELREFHEMAEAAGTTLPKVLERYTAMETLLREDVTAGILQIFEHLGIDPVDWATVRAAGYVPAHSSLLPEAAQAVRDGRLPVLPADAPPMSIGVMAQEVERVRPDLVVKDAAGFLMVDYAGLAMRGDAA